MPLKDTEVTRDMDNTGEDFISRPSLLWSISEAGRALIELGLSYPYRLVKKHPKNGDGHPVFVLPGFMSSDFSTGPLRKFIDKLGYKSLPWTLGRNLADDKYLAVLSEKLDEIYETHGEEISLIGWSLGGVFARQLAKEKSHLIRQVITLGSPFGGITKPNNAAWIYSLVSGGKTVRDVNPELIKDIPRPAPVPTTAIYTKEDGIVNWKVCIEKIDSPIHQNIQVYGSHLALGVNPTVLNIVADRLSYTKENWQPFVAKSKASELLFYPG